MVDIAWGSASQRFTIEDLVALSDSANSILEGLRSKMLEPHPRKKAPVLTSAQVAALCGVESTEVPYLAKRADLPPGTHTGKGTRRVFSVAETRQWVHALSKIPKKPLGVDAAVIAVVNFKGGSTKTTTAFNLAQGLTLRGRRVLLVDLDPQGSATVLTGLLPAVEVLEEHTAGLITYPPVMEKDTVIWAPPTDLTYAVQSTYWDGLDLIPAAPTLFNAEVFLPLHSKNADTQWWDMLNKALVPLRQQYDVIIMDTAPALSYLAVNAVIAADGLIMPLPPENLDYTSSVAFWNLLAETLTRLKDGRNLNKEFGFMRVLLSRVPTNKFAQSIVKDWIIATYGRHILPMEIPQSDVSSMGGMQFGTVYDVSRPNDKIRNAYERFVEMIDQSIMASIWKMRPEDE
jgi:chromosome partitioning protein